MRVSLPRVRFVLLTSVSCLALALGAMPHARAQQTPAQQAPAQQPTVGEPAGYRATVEEAKREYDRGNYEEARALFAKANAIFPNARALRGLGMTQFELKNYGDCVHSLEQSLESKVKPLEGDLLTQTRLLLERAQSFVARLHVTIEPGEAMVVVDGVPVKLDPRGSMMLDIGSHVLEFRAEGYTPEKRVIKVIGGEAESLRVVLPREDVAKAPIITTDPASAGQNDQPRKPLYKNAWLWTGVGVATAAVATGLALGLSRGSGTQNPPVASPWETATIR